MISKWMQRRSFLIVVSFILAMLLFVYADESSQSRQSSSISVQTQYNTISNVPVYVDMDNEQYTVSGLPDTVTLRLEGSSSSLLAVTGNSSYRVRTPNLNDLGPGRHTISLEVTGLPSGVTGSVSPEMVEIEIESKATVELPVQVSVNRSNLTGAYKDGQAVLNPARVSVTGPESVVNQVEQVVTTVVVPENTRSDYTTTATLQAVDASGKPLSVQLNPERIQVRVPITTNSKEVPIVLTSNGSAGSQYSYQLRSDTTKVTLLGSQEVLDSITALPVLVDVSNVTQTTTQVVKPTLPNGIDSITPENISVTITVTGGSAATTQDETTTTTTETTTTAR